MTRQVRSLGRSSRRGAVIAIAALSLLAPVSLAQEATPAGMAQTGDGPHPAHIHSGTCAEIGDVVVPLTDLAERSGEQMGSGTVHAVKGSFTRVEMPFDDLLASPHAINVHLSADEIDTYIACGDISGVVFVDSEDGEHQMVIGLGELNDSGHVGIAYITEDEGDATEVAVNLIEPEEMS